MNKIATSVEQSKELLELGIDPNTASMFWAHLNTKNKDKNSGEIISVLHVLESRSMSSFEEIEKCQSDCVSFSPAWSFIELIELLPSEFTDKRFSRGALVDGEDYYLVIDKTSISYCPKNDSNGYIIRETLNKDESLIDVAVRVIKILKEGKIF